MPEDTELATLLRRGVPQLLHPCEGVVDAEVLVVPGEQLDTVSRETDPSSPSELIFFHSEKNSQPDVMVPTLLSEPLERTRNPFGVKRCGMESR